MEDCNIATPLPCADEVMPHTSDILSTCRTITTEALPILYRSNTLSFNLGFPDPEEETSASASTSPQSDPDIFTYNPDA